MPVRRGLRGVTFVAAAVLLMATLASVARAEPVCRDLFRRDEVRLVETGDLSAKPGPSAQKDGFDRTHRLIRILFDLYEKAPSKDMESVPPQEVLMAVIEQHLNATLALLRERGSDFKLIEFEGTPAIEILPERMDGGLNRLADGLDNSAPVRLIYAPVLLARFHAAGFYAPGSNDFATSARSVRDNKVDNTFTHEARHRYFDVMTEKGTPMIFSTQIVFKTRAGESAHGEFGSSSYAKSMSVEELVTHCQDILTLARWLKKADPEHRKEYMGTLDFKSHMTLGIAENTRQGMVLAKEILSSAENGPLGMKTIETEGGGRFVEIALGGNDRLVIKKINDKVISAVLARGENHVAFQAVGSFGAWWKRAAGKEKFVDARELNALLAGLRAQAEALTASAEAVLPALESFREMMEGKSEKKVEYADFLEAASRPRRLLAPWLTKPVVAGQR